ncbi:MAG: hypothetical protein ACLQDY_02615 [Streptosporangiaceae bacterium]
MTVPKEVLVTAQHGLDLAQGALERQLQRLVDADDPAGRVRGRMCGGHHPAERVAPMQLMAAAYGTQNQHRT